jgi:hypothetical protein
MGLLMAITSVQINIQNAARYAAYEALWEVCKRAGDYENDEARQRAIEQLTSERFLEYVAPLPQVYRMHDRRIELKLPRVRPDIRLRRAENGFALMKVKLPSGTLVKAGSLDGKLELTLPLKSFEIFIDSRYFLLQERMNEFIRELEDVRSGWRWAEYAFAWGEALAGQVRLNKPRSAALFELAWANHELSKFGSADYFAVAPKLAGLDGGATANSYSSLSATYKSSKDLRVAISYLNRCIKALEEAGAEILDIEACIESAQSIAENSDEKLEGVTERVGRALELVQEVRSLFQYTLDFIAGRSENDALMAQLYQGLTTSQGNRPPLTRQVSLGVEGIEEKLFRLKEELKAPELQQGKLPLGVQERIRGCVRSLLAKPLPKYRESYIDYSDPSAGADEDPSPKTRSAQIYIVSKNDGTVASLKATLADLKGNLERLASIEERVESERGKGTMIDEKLTQTLLGMDLLSERLPNRINREQMYEFLPPKPIRPKPGLSVFHELNVAQVKYERRDPCGVLAGARAPPTPIPLWFIGVTFYWAQWEVTLELEGRPIEQIFDFDNPVLLRPVPEAESETIHKPLAYRYEVPLDRFSFELIIVSPKPFSID